MKKHTTFVITRRLLKKAGACRGGIERVVHLLPAKLSTDPEKNYKIAFALADSDAAHDGTDDAHFLAGMYSGEYDKLPDEHLLVGAHFNTERDAYVTAQYLAWVADALLTKAGR